jgi:propionyl-CoA carboxylase beta chain
MDIYIFKEEQKRKMKKELEHLQIWRAKVEMGGGKRRIAKQHEAGKLTARERIDLLLDKDTFVELDIFSSGEYVRNGLEGMEHPGEGVVTGYGKVNSRLVYVFSQDFTVSGGSLGEVHASKICKIMDLAMKVGAPVIGINDSGGARIQEGVNALSGYGEIFFRNTISSGVIPQVSIIAGPCAGGAVYSPALTDFVFMIKGSSKAFITGPQVIKAVTYEEVTPEQLGGAMAHNKTSGCAHFMAADEEDCINQVKKLLSFLPQNNRQEPPRAEPLENHRVEELTDILPASSKQHYDVRDVVKRVVDSGELFEVHQYYARNVVVGFARIRGCSVGIAANQPKFLAGCLDINSSDKLSRFVRFCDSFNIPLVTFVDVPGFLPGTGQEYGGIIRHGAKILYAYAEATVPKITVILRKAYGGAYIAMCSRSLRADAIFAWPTAEIAVMGPEGAANIVYRSEIEQAKDPEALKAEKIELYREKYSNPYIAAARGMIDDVIDPRDTRKKIVQSLEMLETKRETRPKKKHGNIPL